MENAPCYRCSDRCSGCHSKCTKYTEWVDNQRSEKKALIKSKGLDNDIISGVRTNQNSGYKNKMGR